MFIIKCKELTNVDCDFVAEALTAEEAKEIFFAHDAEAPEHEEKFYSTTDEEKEKFEEKIDKYLEKQD